ncbi:MFS general substrate transporter [Aspergillus steynii IBT 23096]|uniref:MFS general substrate transporter n=1 Tax=Aspergillus steynii IBT 23096 TaxID=1392250 RepID=A0A2I2GHH6_9EURO|nr:MFS general substrate transporter [Aspergillus steynii IBT 23096]PLB52330.1 MFS general substrate transporter [Aspergillus steynii IBT 23096]
MPGPDKKHSEITIEVTSRSISSAVTSDESTEHAGNNHPDVSSSSSAEDENVVDWTGPNDPDMPLNWPRYRQFSIIAVVTACRFTAMLSSSMMSPALAQVETEFKDASQTLITFTVSIYVIGCAVGPLVLAPLSETYGRYWVYHAGNIAYTIFSAACALSPSAGALLSFRLLAGFAGGVPITNAGGTVADMIPRERRGFIMGAALIISPTFAPVVGGFLAEAMGWRWIFWFITIVSGLVTILSFFLLHETYSPVLLQHKAASLRRKTGNSQLRALSETRELPFWKKMQRALRRPLVLLVSSPILIIMSLYAAFVQGVTYIILTSMPIAFSDIYGWGEGVVGLSAVSLGIGCLIAIIITGQFSDRIYLRQKEKSGDANQPESRLFFLFPAAVTLPAGILIYGWTVHFESHWIAPLIGTGTFGLGMVLATTAIMTYIVDAFSVYSASALAANGLVRGIAGGLLLLGGPKLFERLGYGWGGTLLGFLSVAFGGASLALWTFGKALRTRFPVDLE